MELIIIVTIPCFVEGIRC